jgi:hypothetical protein
MILDYDYKMENKVNRASSSLRTRIVFMLLFFEYPLTF